MIVFEIDAILLPGGHANEHSRLNERKIEQPRTRATRHLRLRLILFAHLILQVSDSIHRLVQVFDTLLDWREVLSLGELDEIGRVAYSQLRAHLHRRVALLPICEARNVHALDRGIIIKGALPLGIG